MKGALFEWLLLPFVMWGVFQGLLFYNSNMVEEAINIAIYEGAKQAAVQGRYTEDIYDEMETYLAKHHKFDPAKLEIVGTEDLKLRGEYLRIEVTIPKPRTNVMDLFQINDSSEVFTFEKYIMSEYVQP